MRTKTNDIQYKKMNNQACKLWIKIKIHSYKRFIFLVKKMNEKCKTKQNYSNDSNCFCLFVGWLVDWFKQFQANQ